MEDDLRQAHPVASAEPAAEAAVDTHRAEPEGFVKAHAGEVVKTSTTEDGRYWIRTSDFFGVNEAIYR